MFATDKFRETEASFQTVGHRWPRSRLVARQLRYLELLQRAEARKEQQRAQMVERAREMDERVKYRQAVAAEIQRAKVIATIQAWNREERQRRARMQKQQLQLQEYKEQEVRAGWGGAGPMPVGCALASPGLTAHPRRAGAAAVAGQDRVPAGA